MEDNTGSILATSETPGKAVQGNQLQPILRPLSGLPLLCVSETAFLFTVFENIFYWRTSSSSVSAEGRYIFIFGSVITDSLGQFH